MIYHLVICNAFKLEPRFDQTSSYQKVSFSVYIHNLMFVFFLIKCSETSLGAVVITTYHDWPVTTFSGLKQVIHDQTRQYGYQTVPFSVYIHNLIFVFLFDQVF